MNPLKGACATASRCTASAGTSNIPDATDQNVYTGAFVSLPAGTPAGTPGAFVQARLPAPATVTRASVKGFGTAPLDVILIRVGVPQLSTWRTRVSASVPCAPPYRS
jgi:hypothetical protein